MIVIGSARIDENKKISGGQEGDQVQSSSPDFKGEVSQQNFYVHSKGWNILRAKDETVAVKLAEAMIRACENKHIGYNQNKRLEIISGTTLSENDISCDCSSLVRECVIEATGKDPGNFNTSNEATVLAKTKLFDKVKFTSENDLFAGDILVTKTKGHTVIVTNGPVRDKKMDNQNIKPELDSAIEVIAKYAIKGYFGNGYSRKENIYNTVQMKVNQLLNRR